MERRVVKASVAITSMMTIRVREALWGGRREEREEKPSSYLSEVLAGSEEAGASHCL